MASTYVNDLRLNELATGDASGTWGTITNTNLELIAEAFSFGTEGITTNADTHTSTIADGATDPVRSMYVKYTGTLDSACTITIAPNTVSKLWFIENGTSGSQNIIISQGTGANVTIPAGDTKVVYSDGAGSGAAVVDAFASLSTVDLKVQDDLTVTDDASVGGDLLVSGEVQTANIGFTDGDNAITIADGGGITAANGITSTAAANTFGATSFNDANITNVGDIALDSLSADDSSISIASPVVINGSTPTLTIGDAGAEDTKIVFNGNAQDYYIGLDDSADDLIIGKGSTVGTTPAVVIDENLNVGIGTTSPARPLHIENAEARLVRLSHTSNPKIEFVDTTNGTSGAYLGSEDNELTFETGGQNERMRIDSAGNVGIGVTNPASNQGFAKAVEISDEGATTGPDLMLTNPTAGTDEFLGELSFNHANDALAAIAAKTDGATDSGHIQFLTQVTGGALQEKMRIDSDGNLLLGTTTRLNNSNTIAKTTDHVPLNIRRDNGASDNSILICYKSTSTAVLAIRGDGDVENTNNSYGALSDKRLKSNIVDANSQLEDIKKVKVRNYTLDSTGETHIGVIAQELEESGMGGLVEEREEGYKGVKYSILYMKAIKAIQEQQELIETQQTTINDLKSRIEVLETPEAE
jgi:hypothetical protein